MGNIYKRSVHRTRTYSISPGTDGQISTSYDLDLALGIKARLSNQFPSQTFPRFPNETSRCQGEGKRDF